MNSGSSCLHVPRIWGLCHHVCFVLVRSYSVAQVGLEFTGWPWAHNPCASTFQGSHLSQQDRNSEGSLYTPWQLTTARHSSAMGSGTLTKQQTKQTKKMCLWFYSAKENLPRPQEAFEWKLTITGMPHLWETQSALACVQCSVID